MPKPDNYLHGVLDVVVENFADIWVVNGLNVAIVNKLHLHLAVSWQPSDPRPVPVVVFGVSGSADHVWNTRIHPYEILILSIFFSCFFFFLLPLQSLTWQHVATVKSVPAAFTSSRHITSQDNLMVVYMWKDLNSWSLHADALKVEHSMYMCTCTSVNIQQKLCTQNLSQIRVNIQLLAENWNKHITFLAKI